MCGWGLQTVQKNEKVITAVKGWKHLDNRELPLLDFKVLFILTLESRSQTDKSHKIFNKSGQILHSFHRVARGTENVFKIKGKKKASFPTEMSKTDVAEMLKRR